MFANPDRILALVLGAFFAMIAVFMVFHWHWRFPDWQDLPSARLNLFLNGGPVRVSLEAGTDADANETTQIPIFQELYERELLNKFAPSRKLVLDELSLMPGLAHTRSFDAWEGLPAMSRHMVPQGVAVSDKWIFVSAYDGAYQTNSVIYLIDKATGKLAKTIVLEGQPHVGGLAYDDTVDRLWIATHKGKVAQLASVSLEKLEAYKAEENKLLTYDTQISIVGPKRASFVEYFEGSLYVGYFDVAGPGILCRYRLTWGGELLGEVASSPTETWEIPTRAQGVALTKDFVFVSQSYGVESSRLYVYERQKTRTPHADPFVSKTHAATKDVVELARLRTRAADKSADILLNFAQKQQDRVGATPAAKASNTQTGSAAEGSAGTTKPSARSLNANFVNSAAESIKRIANQARKASKKAAQYHSNYIACLRLPPMMEDISVKDGLLYAVYESGAAIYREKYGVGVDRVIAYPLEVILEQAGVTDDE
ncbi:YncE family protein [uncultured Olegusella sp.]|uniref:YncE family protein n=1 Tax=uncultured Olegusella sp. TaxID=1979846 RepID=UPI002607CEA1|nr:hypothetical protein [uncultured Olegusella sp.]